MDLPQSRTADVAVATYLNVRTATTPAWVDDGQVAYLSDATGVPQVWLTAIDGGSPRRLTDFPERIGSLTASPAGGRLVFGMDSGGNERQQLWLLDPASGEARALTDDLETIHQIGPIAPSGDVIAFGNNARDPRYFDVSVVRLDDPSAEPALLIAPNELLAAVAISPDGTRLLLRRSNTNLDADLLLMPLAGGEPVLMTPHDGEASVGVAAFDPAGNAIYAVSNQDRDWAVLLRIDLATRRQTVIAEAAWDVESLAVSPDGHRLAYGINEGGRSRLMLRETAGGTDREVTGLAVGVIDGLTWSPDGEHLAFALSGPAHPADIWVCDTAGSTRQLTESDLAGLDRSSFARPEVVHYSTFDGRPIPALWYTPDETAGPWPVIVDVHGGPESQRRVGFVAVTQFFLARGFAVLSPNVRGSTGYGKTYSHLDDVEKRMDSVADLAAAVDWLQARDDVRSDRIAVMGGSYGGFMTLAALTTYPERWAAGVDIVGIANFVTFLEQTGPWRRRVRAAEYGDPERDAALLRDISPLHKVDRITAPLLVIHGANDPRVPLGEAEQIVAALRARDREVDLLLFDDEGHGVVKLPNRITAYTAIASFLDRVLGGG